LTTASFIAPYSSLLYKLKPQRVRASVSTDTPEPHLPSDAIDDQHERTDLSALNVTYSQLCEVGRMGMKRANYPMPQATGRIRDWLPILLKQSEASTALCTVRQANQLKHPRTVNDNPTDLPVVLHLTHRNAQKLLQVVLSHFIWVSPFHHVPAAVRRPNKIVYWSEK
jgi:hypothetical protein